jgi:hypothetical protein
MTLSHVTGKWIGTAALTMLANTAAVRLGATVPNLILLNLLMAAMLVAIKEARVAYAQSMQRDADPWKAALPCAPVDGPLL